MSIVAEEVDETLFWLEMLVETDFISMEKVKPTLDETLGIVKVVSKARKNARS